MSKATKLLHTRYRVNDLEKTVNFYKDVLGLEETRRRFGSLHLTENRPASARKSKRVEESSSGAISKTESA